MVKRYYKQNMVVISKWGTIDFSPDNFETIVGKGSMTYDEYLDIQHKSASLSRLGFGRCFYEGRYASFTGQITRIDKKKGKLCFKRIYISGTYQDGTCFEEKEDHVWMDAAEFKNFNCGDKICFGAEVYRYLKRGTGKRIDYALRSPYNIAIVEDYSLPSDEELLMQTIDEMICEVCLYKDQCYLGMCIANEEWRRNMRLMLKASMK